MIFPAHTLTEKVAKSFGPLFFGIRAIKRQRFLEFQQPEAGARLALIDSVGVREETCILGVPCVTLRENTERPETVDVGANVLAVDCAFEMPKSDQWKAISVRWLEKCLLGRQGRQFDPRFHVGIEIWKTNALLVPRIKYLFD